MQRREETFCADYFYALPIERRGMQLNTEKNKPHTKSLNTRGVQQINEYVNESRNARE